MKEMMISYYSENHKCFVYIGKDPLPNDVSIDAENVLETLKIKARPKAVPQYGDFLLGSSGAVSKGSRRTKERKIGDVIKKVS